VLGGVLQNYPMEGGAKTAIFGTLFGNIAIAVTKICRSRRYRQFSNVVRGHSLGSGYGTNC